MRKLAALVVVSFFLSVTHAQDNASPDPNGTQAEREAFFNAGYNSKHYSRAQTYNLDLDNYRILRNNKKKKIKGAIMMGVGGGFVGAGALYAVLGAAMKSQHRETVYYYDNFDELGTIYMIIGGASAVGGTVSMVIGGVSLGSRRPVMRKDGSRLSLDIAPLLDPVSNTYGTQLSVRF